jgi:hypothetical protein
MNAVMNLPNLAPRSQLLYEYEYVSLYWGGSKTFEDRCLRVNNDNVSESSAAANSNTTETSTF